MILTSQQLSSLQLVLVSSFVLAIQVTIPATCSEFSEERKCFAWSETILATNQTQQLHFGPNSSTIAGCSSYCRGFPAGTRLRSSKEPRPMDGVQSIGAEDGTRTGVQHDDEQDELMRALTRPKNNQLPALTASYTPNHPEHLRACENFFHRHDELDKRYTIGDMGLMGLMAMVHATVYRDAYMHRYDNFHDMKLAAGPEVDQELCLRQLDELNERARAQSLQKYRSRDINLYQLFDTYGRMSSGLLLGASFYEGMYSECIRLKINTRDEQRLSTRYCVASVKPLDWPKVDKFDILNLKIAVCLPRSCDSVNYKHKYQLVQRLVEHQVRQLEKSMANINYLYCLPDEDSPLRSIASSPSSAVALAGLIGWLVFLTYATIKYEQTKRKEARKLVQKAPPASGVGKSFGLTSGLAVRENEAEDSAQGSHSGQSAIHMHDNNLWSQIYKLLSISNNLKLLFDTNRESSLVESCVRPTENTRGRQDVDGASRQADASAEDCTNGDSDRLPPEHATPQPGPVDLRCIEGIKVIAMCYVIMGHVLMCSTNLMSNGREFASSNALAFWLANLVPAFAVNSFFTITGLLTCYLIFKQGHRGQSMVSSPSKWMAFVIYRYLRIMPMYALVVVYAKHLAKYLGSGPLWDYGTSSLAQRRACEQEPWANVWLFRANFVPPLEHCIPSAWYLANDFQFFIVTPLFLACLRRSARWGERLLGLSILLGFMAGIWSILGSQLDDLRPIARFSPHGFKTYISHFSYSYTQPQYRIPAYLIGLLIGHKLHRFEQRRKLSPRGEPQPDWPDWFKRHAVSLCLLLVGICCITPFIGSRLPFNKPMAKLMVALITNSYHILFSTSVGIYVLLATTGFGNKYLDGLLAAPVWKPLARLSLCAVLINVEVINYIVQSNTNLHYSNNQFQLGLNIICILATYLASILVCILFEAPIRGALNSLVQVGLRNIAKGG